MASLLVFYTIILVGFLVARGSLRASSLLARTVYLLAGAGILIYASMHYGAGLTRATDIIRYASSAVAVVAAVYIVLGRHPVHCALSLLVVFVCLAAMFVSYQAEFLAAITLSINAGAVVVTFLFILMLIDFRIETGADAGSAWTVAALVSTGALVLLIVVAVAGAGGHPVDGPPPAWFQIAGSAYGSAVQNTRLKGPAPEGVDPTGPWLDEIPPEELRRIRSGQPYPLRPISGYTTHLGWELYTKYTVPFEVASLILTVAVVGAVAVGRQGRGGEAEGGM